MDYPCTKCGCCCKRIDEVIILAERFGTEKFPYNHKDGVCEKLVNNECSVYENRPTVCDVEKMKKFWCEMFNINEETYYKLSIFSCNKMMLEDGLSKEYFIKIKR